MTLPGVLLGIGLAATLDQVVLHLLLRWHHVIDDEGLATGQISDGVFHVFATATLVAGFVLLLRRAPAERPAPRRLAGLVLAGAGGFNVYDSLVQHKLLDLHQVRPGADDVLPYDLVFTGIAVAALVAGLALVRADGSASPRRGGSARTCAPGRARRQARGASAARC